MNRWRLGALLPAGDAGRSASPTECADRPACLRGEIGDRAFLALVLENHSRFNAMWEVEKRAEDADRLERLLH